MMQLVGRSASAKAQIHKQKMWGLDRNKPYMSKYFQLANIVKVTQVFINRFTVMTLIM